MSARENMDMIRNKLRESDLQNNVWEMFQTYFDIVNNDFHKILKENCPTLTPSEIRICCFILTGLSAKEIAQRLKEQINWSKTTTYTVLKKCVEKQAILRKEPGFMCTPLISREEVQKAATDDLINRMYDGSKDLLIASLLGGQEITPDKIAKLKKMAEDLK